MKISTLAFGLFFQFCIFYAKSTNGETCHTLPVPVSELDTYPDYYWRDYIGLIPEDAIKGGTDEAGNPTYVGQAYFEKYELLPVIIYPGCQTAHSTAYTSEVTTDKNIKILCSKYIERFEWIPTKSDETHLLINSHLVVGGYEVGHRLNIGRVKHDGKVVIGKVFSHPLSNKGLWIPYNKAPINFHTYEILTYDVNRIV